MLNPVNDRVIVQRADPEVLLSSGLVLAGVKTEGPLKGVVTAVGPGRLDKGKRCAMDVVPGDTVWYIQGNEIELSGDEVVIPEDNIVARLVDGQVTPYWDKALIELTNAERVLASGLIRINDTEDGYDTGVVLSVGPGYIRRGVRVPTELHAGETVLFNQFMGVEIEAEMQDNRRLYLVREYDVYGVLT